MAEKILQSDRVYANKFLLYFHLEVINVHLKILFSIFQVSTIVMVLIAHWQANYF